MELLREYWYGWKYFTQAEKENVIDTASYKELVYKMHEKGGLSAEKLLGRSSIFWDDMNFKKDNIFFKFQYTKLPAEYGTTTASPVLIPNLPAFSKNNSPSPERQRNIPNPASTFLSSPVK